MLANAALLAIDVQAGFDDPSWGAHNQPRFEANVELLLRAFRDCNRPVVFVRHDSIEPNSPLRPGTPGNQLKSFMTGSADLVVAKRVHNAFAGAPDLHHWLQERKIETVVVCGIATNHCCDTTARAACDLGYQVEFVIDATRTFDRTGPTGVRLSADALALATAASLHGEFANVTTTDELIERLRAHSGPQTPRTVVAGRHSSPRIASAFASECWALVNDANLSILEQRAAPHAREQPHLHRYAGQFLYMLHGRATLHIDQHTHELTGGQGVHIAAGSLHWLENCSDEEVGFLLVSHPPAGADRVELHELTASSTT